MSRLTDAIKTIFSRNTKEELKGLNPQRPVTKQTVPRSGRSSVSDHPVNGSAFPYVTSKLHFVTPEFNREAIKTIRQLVKVNPDFGLALNNIVSLGNTGFKIYFDNAVKDSQVDRMQSHIEAKMEEWGEYNYTSPTGLVDKMFKQVMIGGAISTEWAANQNMNSIENVYYLMPERIEFAYNKRKKIYTPYQRISNLTSNARKTRGKPAIDLKKLNLYSFKYWGLPSDTESPYGIPPYLNGLEPLNTEYKMLDNINYIIEQLGLWGFMEVLMDKPIQEDGESDKKYQVRAENFLDQVRARTQKGFRDGMLIGYKDDTEFKFNSTTKDARGVRDVYSLNWNRTIRGLNSDPALFGGDDSRSETQIGIVFTKMLSELANIQSLVTCNLNFGLTRELRLAGYRFEKARTEFNASTLQDALKLEQAREIRIRNNNALYYDGIISLHTYAKNVGQEKPDQNEPRVERVHSQQGQVDKEKREADKDKSDRKGRRKEKPQPKDDKK